VFVNAYLRLRKVCRKFFDSLRPHLRSSHQRLVSWITCTVANTVCDRRTCDNCLRPFVNRAPGLSALMIFLFLCVCMFSTAYCTWLSVCEMNDRCSCECCVFYDIRMVATYADARRQIVSSIFSHHMNLLMHFYSICQIKIKTKLETWDRAQREATMRRKSDWKTL